MTDWLERHSFPLPKPILTRPVMYIWPYWWYGDDHCDSKILHNYHEQKPTDDLPPPPQCHRTVRRRARENTPVSVCLMVDRMGGMS